MKGEDKVEENRMESRKTSPFVVCIVIAVCIGMIAALVVAFVAPVWRVHRAIAGYRGQHSCESGGFLPGKSGAFALTTVLRSGNAGLSDLRLFLKCHRMHDRWIAIELLASYGHQTAPDLVDELFGGATVTDAEGISYTVDGGSAQSALIVLGDRAIPVIKSRLMRSRGPDRAVLLELVACIPGSASSMLPELVSIVQQPGSASTTIAAVYAVSSAGEAAIPQLRQLLNSRTPEASETAAAMLLWRGWDESPDVVRRVEDGVKRDGLLKRLCGEALRAKQSRDRRREGVHGD